MDCSGRIDAMPVWITSARGGAGFAPLADVLMAARRG